MRRGRLVAFGVVVIGAIGWWWTRGGEPTAQRGAEARRDAVMGKDGGAGRGGRGRGKPRQMVSPVKPAPVPAEAPAFKPSMARMFESLCEYSPRERCRAGEPLGVRCDAGDAAACVAMAELFFAPPGQPIFGTAFLGQACKLGDAAACERHRLHKAWMKWPEGSKPGDPTPGEACDAGDLVACFHATYWPSARREEVNMKWAWKACQGGVADICGNLAFGGVDAATALMAMDIACRSRSPLHCGVMASMHGDGAVCCQDPPDLDSEGEPLSCIRCPDFDQRRADEYAAQVEALTGKPYEPYYGPEDEDEDGDVVARDAADELP